MIGFEKIVEERIKKARQEGAFDNLPGTGQPLNLEDDRHIPEDLRLVHKILKNAGFVPPEVALKKEITTTEALLAETEETQEKYRIMKRLNYLQMKLNQSRDSGRALNFSDAYQSCLVKRLGSQKR